MIRAKYLAALVLFLVIANALTAQNVYTIKADSVKITGCDSSELIIENHSQAVKGFLYNTGNGRTIFKRGMEKLNKGLYLIGADSLNLGAISWMQGGNAFGATGVLGTLDTFDLDLYSNNVQRARLTKTGNFLLGTTTDNGKKLQVDGTSSFSGNVNIGTATITNTGNLIGTNALLFNYVVPKYHNYRYNSDPYIGRLENVLYNYQSRFPYTISTDANGAATIDILFPASELAPGNVGITYPAGFMAFSFWNNGIPQSVSVLMKDSLTGTWFGPFESNTNIGYGGAGFFQVAIPGSFNWLNEIKVTITPQPGIAINLQDMEYLPADAGGGLLNPLPYVSKETNEYLYNNFYFRSGGVDKIRLSAFQNSYFLNYLGIGTESPSAQLHTTGGVRFAGLTNSNSQTRVLVSDADGNLYYRDASTLATDEILRSSLAVNGPIRARSLTLTATAKDWPDYVFDSSYRLPDLEEVGAFVKSKGHLPGVASATEVAGSGIDVGENQAALLKKIEELTLYALGQHEQLKAQAHELEQLKAKAHELEAVKNEIKELKKMIINKTRK